MSTAGSGKTLLITGASKGIGFETARQFVNKGYRVINVSRSEACHADIENFKLDLGQEEAEAKIIKFVSEQLSAGEICLVHNAAKLNNDTANATNSGSFRDVLELNVVAPHILNQHILPLMKAGSSIIYIGSTLSEKAVANTYSYVVSKHAIIGMMRATCQDLKGSGIHTACICPGFTDTEMLQTHIQGNAEVLESISAMSTFGRLIDPAEIARTICFAAQNPVINGAVLHANLGQVES